MRIIFDLINHIVYLFSGIDKIELRQASVYFTQSTAHLINLFNSKNSTIFLPLPQ